MHTLVHYLPVEVCLKKVTGSTHAERQKLQPEFKHSLLLEVQRLQDSLGLGIRVIVRYTFRVEEM